MSRKILVSLICIFFLMGFFVTDGKRATASKKLVKITGVPTYNQYPELPTGCEATALAMLLSWGGPDVSKFEVADSLPKGEKVRLIDGEWKGANPNKEFVGDPYSTDGSFGVFEGPILETIKMFMPGKSVDLSGRSFSSLLKIVESGKPVMAWTTINQKQTFNSKNWTDEEGNLIEWYRYEHAVVIIGFDGDQVIVNDPYTGQEEYYNRSLFERNWASMGKRAVTLDIKPTTVMISKSSTSKVKNKKTEGNEPKQLNKNQPLLVKTAEESQQAEKNITTFSASKASSRSEFNRVKKYNDIKENIEIIAIGILHTLKEFNFIKHYPSSFTEAWYAFVNYLPLKSETS